MVMSQLAPGYESKVPEILPVVESIVKGGFHNSSSQLLLAWSKLLLERKQYRLQCKFPRLRCFLFRMVEFTDASSQASPEKSVVIVRTLL